MKASDHFIMESIVTRVDQNSGLLILHQMLEDYITILCIEPYSTLISIYFTLKTLQSAFFHLLYIFIYIYIFPSLREKVDIHSCEGRNAFQKIFKCTLNNYIHPSLKKKAWNKQ